MSTKVTLEINNKSIPDGMLTPAYLPYSLYRDGTGNRTSVEYVLKFVLLRKPDDKIRLQIKCEGIDEINKKWDDISESDAYEIFKKGADHIGEWIEENDVTDVKPIFPSLELLRPQIKNLLINPPKPTEGI